MRNKYEKICDEAYVKAQKETQIRYKDWLDSPWSGFFEGAPILPTFTEFYRVLPSFIEFHRVLPSFT